MPILPFPAVSLMSVAIRELVVERCPTTAVSMMDLSVEAETFGCAIELRDDEAPAIRGLLVRDEQDAARWNVHAVGAGRRGGRGEIRRAVSAVADAAPAITARGTIRDNAVEESDMVDYELMSATLQKGKAKDLVRLAEEALAEGAPPKDILEKGLIAGMSVIGARFKRNEIYVPEVLVAARAMNKTMAVLEPAMAEAGVKPLGAVVVGTVQGDMHDIGKNLVAMMFKGAGFGVVDLGVDVPAEKFIDSAAETDACIVGLSALLTTTMPAMGETVKALRDAGCRAKIMIGGAPVTQAFAEEIGADAYAADAATAVEVGKHFARN